MLKKYKVVPNFFMALPYLSLHKDVHFYENNGWYWAEDKEWILFTPFNSQNNKYEFIYSDKNIWCDYSYDHSMSGTKRFLDYEYIFDPKSFLSMGGNKWQTFRKNSRKWPQANSEYIYTTEKAKPADVSKLLQIWLENKPDILDGDFLIELALFANRSDTFIAYLYKSTGQLVALNISDENWLYINYRFCITLPGEPYLEEFMRYTFYEGLSKQNKLVNEGGCLDNPGLEKFKDKMNPLYKEKRYSIINK